MLGGALVFAVGALSADGPPSIVPRVTGGAQPMQVAAQIALGPRERVVMLRVGDRELLLGVTPQQITLLREDAAAPVPPAAARGAQPPAFASLLRGMGGSAGNAP